MTIEKYTVYRTTITMTTDVQAEKLGAASALVQQWTDPGLAQVVMTDATTARIGGHEDPARLNRRLSRPNPLVYTVRSSGLPYAE